MSKYTKAELDESREYLCELLKPGDTIYTVIRHVSRSGMYRAINLYVIQDGKPWRIDWHAAKLLEGYDKNHEACRASGCGMDMGFHLVYNLGYQLYPNGYNCPGETCQSNDHFNRVIPPAGTCEDAVQHKHGVCHNLNCVPWHHTDGGYAFRQEWM